MSLRLRLTLVVAVTFALVVIGCTYAAHLSASQQLRSETDAFLLGRSTRFTHASPGELPPRRPRRRRRRAVGGGPPLFDPDAVTQILDSNGHGHAYTPASPHCRSTRAIALLAQKGGHSRFRDITIGDDSYRMLTVALPNQRRGRRSRGASRPTRTC